MRGGTALVRAKESVKGVLLALLYAVLDEVEAERASV